MDRKVYDLVRKIPKGKVSTYGSIGKVLGLNPRVVGRILGKNIDLEGIPCYRVVCGDGRIGGYVLGGEVKARLLGEDCVGVVNEKVLKFKEKLFKF